MTNREKDELRARRDGLRVELEALQAKHTGEWPAEAQTRWDQASAEYRAANDRLQREADLSELDRRATGEPLGTGDRALDRQIEGVGILDCIRAQMGGTDAAAGRALEVSAELERRSGRRAQGIYWNMGIERRVLTTTLPAAGPGGNLVPTDYRPDLFIDRLRNATRVRALGATVLGDLRGNVTIPRRKASVVAGWVAENSPLPVSDPQFDGVTLTPRHAGCITEFSRNMVQQASPDVEQLCRDDMALTLAEVLDAAALAGTGTNNQPRGILATPNVGTVAIGPNGGPITYNAIADLMGQVDDANATAEFGMAFISNSKVRRQLLKIADTTSRPLGLDVLFENGNTAFTNILTPTGTKGTGTNLSPLIYGNFRDLIVGFWSELDILVNPYESTAYSKGNVSIRAMMTCDIAVRHPESFAAITDIAAP